MSSSDNAAAEVEEDRLSTGIKVSWGIGALGTAILMNSVSALIVYYLARVVGMESWIAGLLLSLGRILDAGTDPFMGYISDKTPNKWGGRRRPYLLIGAVLSAISILGSAWGTNPSPSARWSGS